MCTSPLDGQNFLLLHVFNYIPSISKISSTILNADHKAEWECVIYKEVVELFAVVILMRLLGEVVW